MENGLGVKAKGSIIFKIDKRQLSSFRKEMKMVWTMVLTVQRIEIGRIEKIGRNDYAGEIVM